MGQCNESSWFQSAQANNLVDLKMQRRYGTVDDNEASRFFGFSAIHYAAYFGAKQAV